MNSYAEIEYIRREYIKQGVLNKDGTKTPPGPSGIDYCIYPWEKGYIPKCSTCSEMFNTFVASKDNKDKAIRALHKHCGCLWFNYFKTKILSVNPNASFV